MNNSDNREIELIGIDLDFEETAGSGKEPDPVVIDNEDKVEEIKESKKKRNVAKEVLSYILVIVIALVIAIVVNNFVIINATVPTNSMANTINENDKLFGYRLAYMFFEPQRGDVVIFEHQCYKNSDKEALVKRVIGIENDTIEIVNGVLYRNGKAIEEDFLAEPMKGNYGPYVVPADCYFLLGDNRNISDDARFWDYPYVKEEDIIAQAVFKYSPAFESIK